MTQEDNNDNTWYESTKPSNVIDINNPSSQDTDRLTPEQRGKVDKFEQEIESALSPDTPYSDQMDQLIKLQSSIAPLVYEELVNPMGSVDRSVIAARASTILKEITGAIVKKRETELKDDIDPTSPKFQLVFEWFIELFSEVLHDHADPIAINNVFDDLSHRLIGWEDTIAKRIQGLSKKAMVNVTNPFMDKLREQSQLAIEANQEVVGDDFKRDGEYHPNDDKE